MKFSLRQAFFYVLLFFLLGMLSIPIDAYALWMLNSDSMFFFWVLILIPPIVYYLLLRKTLQYFKETISSWKPIYFIPVLLASVIITAMPHAFFVAMF